MKTIRCDICGKDVTNTIYENQEMISIRNNCGYGSVFGDGNIIELDICQSCLKRKLGEFIRVIEFETMNGKETC